MHIRVYSQYSESVKTVNLGEDILYFSFKDSGFKCGTCGKLDKSVIQISKPTIEAIKYIVLAPPKKLYSFNVQESTIKELEIISKIYLNQKLEKEYKLEDF